MGGSKVERQAAIVRLTRRGQVKSQDELVRALSRLGHRVTQSSVSRDTRELGLVKVAGKYALSAPARPRASGPPAARVLLSASPVGANLIVVRTPAGGASLAADFLDHAGRSELVGSLAGDDTIFIAVKGRSDQGRLLAWLRGFTKGRTE